MSGNQSFAAPGQPAAAPVRTPQQIGVKYSCGACGYENLLKAKEPVQCKHCGFRILYKMRTNKMVQFVAR